MVARITVPRSIRAALHYNEQKVRKGQAACLLASGFLKEANELSFHEKCARFEGLIGLNRHATTNSVHISLNFAEGEQLPTEKFIQIATLYMDKIGFSGQPFLVYEHRDAGHPHLHIVTTNIQSNGRRISLHNLGRGASAKARKELEIQFGLVRAGEKNKNVIKLTAPLFTRKAIYGKSPTKQAITNVLQAVLPHYEYASLPELNAILKQYGVWADRGSENSTTYLKGGLRYQLLDEHGHKAGVPIKASALAGQPTLSYLEQRFRENAALKQAHQKKLQGAIDWVLTQPPRSLAALEKALQAENITLVKRQNEEGFIYGLTYIDHRSNCVFNGSDLGRRYSAKAILETCGLAQAPATAKPLEVSNAHVLAAAPAGNKKSRWNEGAALALLEGLLQAEPQLENLPFELRKRKKKKKKF